MKSLSRRVIKMERAITGAVKPLALVIVHSANKHHDDLVGVFGLNIPMRRSTETADDLVERLERHVLQTRGRAIPFVGMARYSTDSY
jgi:hypothetical protein